MISVSAQRNQQPILTIMERYLGFFYSGTMLEISSGFGQHVSFFAKKLPKIEFQPTEYDLNLLDSIDYYVNQMNLTNVLCARYIDVSSEPDEWFEGELIEKKFDYVLNINMMHITEWNCTEGLFKGSSYVLKQNGKLFTYGPYADNGVIIPRSNIHFDYCLKSVNPAWGLRDITKQLIPVANKYGLTLFDKVKMPANNFFLVWRKQI